MNPPSSVTPADLAVALHTGLRAIGVRGPVTIDLSPAGYVVVTLAARALVMVATHLRAVVTIGRAGRRYFTADLPGCTVQFVSAPSAGKRHA